MRRKSDRGKGKSAPKEQSPEKPIRKSSRHSRRRKKSTSSSDSDSSPRTADKDVSEPLEIQVQDIELPNDAPVPPSEDVQNVNHKPEEAKKEWKEDTAFWESESKKPTEDNAAEGSSKDKEESSLWKVQSANGAGGEIQKLKICRQKPTESPEIGETSLRKRLSRGIKDSRSTDESTQDESEKESKKSRHRTRTSSRNSPLVSPTVKCDQESPTKIKIINVSNLAVEEKIESVTERVESETPCDKEEKFKPEQVQEDSQVSDTLDIALPAEESSLEKNEVDKSEKTGENIVPSDEEVKDHGKKIEVPTTEKKNGSKKEVDEQKEIKHVKDNESLETEKKGPSEKESSPPKESPDEKKEVPKSPFSRASSDDSDGEDLASASKRRTGPQSSVQRKHSPKHKSPERMRNGKAPVVQWMPPEMVKQAEGLMAEKMAEIVSRMLRGEVPGLVKKGISEDEEVKKKEDHERESSDAQDTKKLVNDNEIEAENFLHIKENNLEETIEKEEPTPRPPMPRKRRWGSSKANRPEKKPVLSISTDSLKNLIPDAKPVPADELQLSVEEEEGQLDDDEEEDDVIALVAKDEEKQLREERERQREERQRERERELEERRKRKEQERLERKQQEQLAPTETVEKGSSGRKIHLLTDDNRKLARAPSPPRRKPTSILYITHLVRPFTVQQLKNLLLRTGTIAENGFWIDKIKSKCYVEYATEDQAIETRHALHGVRWPTSNPKTLVVEFACHDDLVMAQTLSEEPEVPRKAEPLTMVEGWLAEQNRMKDRTHRTVREWDVGKPEHPDEVLEYDHKLKEKKEQERKSRKERHHRSATPEDNHPARKARKKEEDAPAKLLDDLFRKTKTSPCIYWLPLTQEQIAVKEEIRRQHMAEHERRMAELKKAEIARRERERRSRK